jgi:hypothetical protein
MKKAVALSVLLVIGILALWPRGGQVIEAPGVEAMPGGAVESGGVVLPDGAPARSGPSLHARITEAATAPVPDRIITLPGWDDIPAPVPVSGPPGKPGLMEGATKEEVLAAWGPPAQVNPGRTDDYSPSDLSKFGFTSMRWLEEWQYEAGGGLAGFAWFDSGGRLCGSNIHPIDAHRHILIMEHLANAGRAEMAAWHQNEPNFEAPPATPESAGRMADAMERFAEQRQETGGQ